MKSIQEHLRQLFQTVPTSKILKVPLCFDAFFEHFKQSKVQDVSQKIPLHRPISITKAVNGLFKFYGNRA